MRAPSAASPAPTVCSITSPPSWRTTPTSTTPAEGCRSSDVTPSQRATGSTVIPWSSVESSTAKKTMLKNSADLGRARA